MMPIDAISDWEARVARQDAFWACAIIDRPVVCMTVRKEKPESPWPSEKTYATCRDRWMDTERVVEQAVAYARNTEYLGDALPTAWPNLGPELFSSFFGMEMDYTADTSWGIPNLHDWSQAGALVFSEENVYWKKLEEMTAALLEAGKGLFYTGFSDMHPGGDAIAAFRDPMQLNLDLLTNPGDVARLLARVNAEYAKVFDTYHAWFAAANQAITSWPGIVSSKKWYVPSNDFSCMISKEMFDTMFVPGIIDECRHLEAAIYHLDGPGALRHLDSLLGIDALNAIQWVFGAGNGVASDWIPVYRRCQAAGKGIQIFASAEEIETLVSNLHPEGVWLGVSVRDREEAMAVLDRVSKWK